MIKSDVIHPQLLAALAKAGHKTQLLISDANYAFVTNAPPGVEIVYLNFVPGMIPSADILEGVCKLINVEKATMMAWPEDFDNSAHRDYVGILPAETPMEFVERGAFYAAAKSPDTLLVIASGEMRRFANILLTVGPVFPATGRA
ncbi:RbsD/FucU family protein [Tropicimonas sp. TH_r6]|uniref:RbsD/FucU family protein n=1 Tax=Tropicimonas sp. TH_r6 TaxID=3082085 RepID=UPI002954464E|nr:RbsD/FucU family protein [Tropicimonas sp. TH_r6]MDV7142087.1 RbsD/FucU family protein [Tropicimonas sp. TH_r6]